MFLCSCVYLSATLSLQLILAIVYETQALFTPASKMRFGRSDHK